MDSRFGGNDVILGEQREMTELSGVLEQEGNAPKKLRGCIAASPGVPFRFCEELTSSSLLSFSLPFYSPPNFLNFAPALLAERVFNLMYSDTGLSCQEESEVCQKKNAKPGLDSPKKQK
jgi:hypothetical protein